MSIKYYGRDLTAGHRDDPYFEAEVDDESSPTGKKYVAFRLICMDGGRVMPEAIHDHIAGCIIKKEIQRPLN